MSSNSAQATSTLVGKHIAILGVGNMGGAIARGLISSNAVAPSHLILSDTDQSKIDSLLSFHSSAQKAESPTAAVEAADIILIAVKGAVLAELLTTISPALSGSKLIVSIVAGKSTETIESLIPKGVRVIRAMPNTPALVLEGATGIARGKYATADDISAALAVFSAVGKVVEVGETLIDAVTGLSGSGPAYIFTVIEALTDGGVLQGLPRDTARLLAAQTVFGAAKMALESSEHVGRLKDQVTTPGGTTIHGLAALEAHGMRAAFIEAVAAATERSKEMG
jgi:pyrroline-5-carboxylate reductase